MKRIFAFIAVSLLMLGCQKSGKSMSFDSVNSGKGSLAVSDLLGEVDDDPSHEDPVIIEEPGEVDDGTTPEVPVVVEDPGEDDGGGSGEDLEPINCNGFSDDKVATSNDCQKAIAEINKMLLLDDGASVKNFSGNFKGKGGHIVTIENTKGNLTMVGIGNAYIEKIVDTKGNLTICNMDVGAVESVSAGNIHIDGGNVCKINGHRGNVKVSNGSVQVVSGNKGNVSVTNGRIDIVDSNKGNVEVINGNIGDVNAHTGNVHVKNGTITGTITNSIGNIRID